jgi:hypothetical protein
MLCLFWFTFFFMQAPSYNTRSEQNPPYATLFFSLFILFLPDEGGAVMRDLHTGSEEPGLMPL